MLTVRFVNVRSCIRSDAAQLTASQGILEDLLEAKELEDGKVDRGVETETTLVRT